MREFFLFLVHYSGKCFGRVNEGELTALVVLGLGDGAGVMEGGRRGGWGVNWTLKAI